MGNQMNEFEQLLKDKEEYDTKVVQYIAWVRQFVPKDAKFPFDPSISASHAMREALQDVRQETV